MKVLVVMLLAGLFAAPAMACEGEAQVIAPIMAMQMSGGSCKALINASKVSFFASSQVCPLSFAEVATEGIEIGLSASDCHLDNSQKIKTISGVVVRTQKGLVLE